MPWFHEASVTRVNWYTAIHGNEIRWISSSFSHIRLQYDYTFC